MFSLLSAAPVHIEVIALLVVAVVGAYIQVLHRYSRKDLRLLHVPGTIASAVSISAETNLAHLLVGRQQENEFLMALQNRKFRIDPQTMKIVMEGEEGYEQATSPSARQSVFERFGFPANLHRRFSSLELRKEPQDFTTA